MDPVHALAIVGRTAAIYAALVGLLRLGGRKELAQMTPLDIITMLLLSEAVSPALTGGDEGLAAGLLSAATLVGCAVATGYLTFRLRWLERAVEGRASVLIRHGRVDEHVLRAHRITDEVLRTALHANGVLRVDQVAAAFVEPSGAITVIPKEEGRGQASAPSASPMAGTSS